MSFKCSIKTLNRLGDSFGDLVFINIPTDSIFHSKFNANAIFTSIFITFIEWHTEASHRITQKCPEVAFRNCYFYSVELIEPAAIYLIYVTHKDSKLLNKSVFGA